MANLNKVMLIGNLTRDVELKYSPKGSAIAEFGMAISRKFKLPDSNETKEETAFVEVTMWGRPAEIAKEYLSKGKNVYIEGRLTYETWDDKTTGQKRNKLKVTGENLQLLGSRGDNVDSSEGGSSSGNRRSESTSSSPDDDYDQRPAPRSQAPASSAPSQQQRPKPRPAPAPVQDDDDDIPF